MDSIFTMTLVETEMNLCVYTETQFQFSLDHRQHCGVISFIYNCQLNEVEAGRAWISRLWLEGGAY